MTEQDQRILKEIRERSQNPDNMESMLYHLLQNASPELVEKVEELAVIYTKVGKQMAKQLQEATDTPEKMRAWEEKMAGIMRGRHANPFDVSDLEE